MQSSLPLTSLSSPLLPTRDGSDDRMDRSGEHRLVAPTRALPALRKVEGIRPHTVNRPMKPRSEAPLSPNGTSFGDQVQEEISQAAKMARVTQQQLRAAQLELTSEKWQANVSLPS